MSSYYECTTLIGKKTGGVVHHAIRCQQCRICDCAAKRGIQPKKHNCKKNWTGSAKAMEPDMLVQMVNDVKNKNVYPNTFYSHFGSIKFFF
jgi:hypothetical protein